MVAELDAVVGSIAIAGCCQDLVSLIGHNTKREKVTMLELLFLAALVKLAVWRRVYK